MGVYDEEIQMALELLTELGTPVTITRMLQGKPGAGDRPATPPIVIVVQTVAVILAVKSHTMYAESLSKGQLTQESARLLYMPGSGQTITVRGGSFTGLFQPDTLDVAIAIDGRAFTILGNDPLSPDNGTPILHKALART